MNFLKCRVRGGLQIISVLAATFGGVSRPHPQLPASEHRTPHYTMPYLKSSTEWYEQSSLLLKARPTSVSTQLPSQVSPLLTQPIDTHHIQIHRPEALSLKDQETRKVPRQADIKALRRIAHIIPAAAIESHRCHRDLRAEDIRPRIRHMLAIRDDKRSRSRAAGSQSGEIGTGNGGAAGGY